MKQINDQNLSGCCATTFGPMAHVSCWSPIAACLRGFHALTHIYSVAATTLGFGFCLSLVLQRDTESFIVIVSISPFTVIQAPCSCSLRLCRLVLSYLELEPLQFRFTLYIFEISDCIFIVFLLVFFDSLAGSSIECAWLILVGAAC